MIISVADLKKHVDCGTTTDEQINFRLKAIEAVIRKYTNNNFQQRDCRFVGSSDEQYVYGHHDHMITGDTVQISNSGVNDGIYEIVSVYDESVQLDRDLMVTDYNMVTKVKYPDDVVQCAVDLYHWKQNMGEKVGIKSETISRHSVTYEDSTTLFMGYPVGILKGLNLYKKARC